MDDGRTVRQHVRMYALRDPVGGAAALADVTPGPVPVDAVMAVHAFEVLSSTRDHGFSGPKPITPADLIAAREVFGLDLTPRESRLVLRMDAAFRDEVAANGR